MVVEELFETLGLKINHAQWAAGEHAVEKMREGLDKIGESKFAEHIKEGMAIFASYEGVKILGEFVNQTVEAAVQAKRLGERVGLTSEAVQELGYAADVSGSSTEGLTVGFQHLARGLNELRTKGTGPAVDAFRSLGISASDAEVRHGKLDQVIEIVANKFKNMPDGVKKTSSAMDLFGREGATLIPLLNKGADGIKELREEAEKLGIVIDEEGIQKAEHFEESQKKLHATLVGLRNQAVMALLPTLQEMADKVFKWVMANREMLKQKLQQFVEGLAKAIQFLAKVVGVVIDVIQFLSQHATLAKFAIIGLALLIGGPWVAAIVVVYDAIQELYELFGKLSDGASSVVKSISAHFEAFGRKMDLLWQKIKDGAHDLWEDIKDIPIIGSVIKGVGGMFSGPAMNPMQMMQSMPGFGGGFAGMMPKESSGSNLTVHGGAIQIDVHGATDPVATGSEVRKQIAESQKDMLRQAMDAIKGGQK